MRTYDQRPLDKDFGPTILIVDDEEIARTQLEIVCSKIEPAGSFRTVACETLSRAAAILAETPVDVVLLDKNIAGDSATPYHNGIEAIPDFLRLQGHLQILMVTGSTEISDIVRAISLGAFNYVVKGSPDGLLVAQIRQAVSVSRLTQDKIRMERAQKRPSIEALSGKSPAMQALKIQLEMVAESNRPVLLLGDSGTGKTTAAKLIHEARQNYLKQPNRSFISLNMAAVTPSMAEAELFGHEAGAFTDARQARPGYIELANHGTLFLDEIGEASLDLQAKLLKVLDDGKFYRLGGKKELQSHFKLVCATNRNLDEMVAARQFRQDLYMRISTFPIRIPTLEERREDIPEIVKALLPKACDENQVFIDYAELPEDFITFLKEHKIDGNIRGIDHILSRLLVLSLRDKRGRPQLTNWRSIVSPLLRKTNARVTQALSLKELLSTPYDVVGENFQGLEAVIEGVSINIIRDALTKFPTHSDAAKVLKLSKAGFSHKLRRLKLETGVKPGRKKKVMPLANEDREGVYQ